MYFGKYVITFQIRKLMNETVKATNINLVIQKYNESSKIFELKKDLCFVIIAKELKNQVE